MFVILGSWLLSLLGVQVPGLFSAGPIGIGLSLVAAALAASNLLLDFDMVRRVPDACCGGQTQHAFRDVGTRGL